jgi:hypothetical protein
LNPQVDYGSTPPLFARRNKRKFNGKLMIVSHENMKPHKYLINNSNNGEHSFITMDGTAATIQPST